MGKINDLFLELIPELTPKGRKILDKLSNELEKELEIIKKLVIIRNIRDALNI